LSFASAAEIVFLVCQPCCNLLSRMPEAATRAGRCDKHMTETEFREESRVIAHTLESTRRRNGRDVGAICHRLGAGQPHGQPAHSRATHVGAMARLFAGACPLIGRPVGLAS
jgi:hypothetical protein